MWTFRRPAGRIRTLRVSPAGQRAFAGCGAAGTLTGAESPSGKDAKSRDICCGRMRTPYAAIETGGDSCDDSGLRMLKARV